MASRGLGTLTLDLVAKIGGFVGPLSKAERELDKRTKSMQSRATAFGKFLGGALVAGAGAAAAGLIAVTKQAIDSADRLNDISQRLGVGTEALSAWGYAAQQSGTDLEALNGGLTRFTKNVAAAMDSGSRQGEIFAALGVSVKDAAGNLRSVEDLLPEIATAFKGMNNATLESALSMELFGRSGAQLLQFLNLGGDGLSEMEARARSLGIVISQDTAEAADEFNDKLADLKALVTGAGLQLAKELLPELIKLVDWFKSAAQEGGAVATVIEWVGHQVELAGRDFAAFAKAGADIVYALEHIRDRFHAVGVAASAAGALMKGNIAGAIQELKRAQGLAEWSTVRGGSAGTVQSGVATAGNAAPAMPNATETALSRLFSGGGGSKARKSGVGGARSGKSDAEREAEQLKAAYDRLNGSLAEQIALHGQTGEAVQLRYDLEHGELSKLTQAQKDSLIVQAERIDQLNAEADVQKELDAINERRTEAVAQVLEDIQTEVDLLGTSIEYQDTYNKLKYAGVDANSAFGQSIIDANHSLHAQAEATAANIELMDEFRGGLVDGLTDIVTGAKSAKEAFKDFFDDMAAKITRMIAEKWIEQAFGQMGTSGSGSGTSGGNWIGALFGAFFGGGKASGGPTFPNTLYEVNERGFEMASVGGRDYMLTGSKPVQITPNNRLGGGTSNLNQTFVVQGTPDRRTREQMARDSGRAARRGMSRTG